MPIARSENHHLQCAGKKVSLLAVFHGWVSARNSADIGLGLEQNSIMAPDGSQETKRRGPAGMVKLVMLPLWLV